MLETNEFNQTIGFEVKNWQHSTRPSRVTMRGRFCVLELLNIDIHANKIYEALSIENKGESWTYLPYGPFDTCDQFKIWLKEKMQDQSILLYAIFDIKKMTPIGIAGYLNITPIHGVIEVGHLHFSKLLQRTPAATEAMYLMMSHAFDDLKYRRYEWKCNSLNQASRNAALRLGFQFEGIFRQNHVFKNRNRDTAWFSIIDSEWPEIKNRFLRWLSPDNFDVDNKQIKKLSEV
jgi:RimJ/RimL family protein N-acetyltransferase